MDTNSRKIFLQACTPITVFVMTPPNEHTSEGRRDDRGSRTMRNRPYPESSAEMLKFFTGELPFSII